MTIEVELHNKCNQNRCAKTSLIAISISIVMESRPNIEEIDFQKYLLVLQRRWISVVGIFGIVVTFAFLFALSVKPAYKVEASLLIKTNKSSSLTGLGEAIGQIESLGVPNNNPSDTQAKIVASVPAIQETIKALELQDSQGKSLKISDFMRKLKIESPKGTDILVISYTDSDPLVAVKVVNKIINVYIRNNIEVNRAEAVSARKFIRQQIPATEASVVKAESDLRKFKEENKIIALSEESARAVQAIANLEAEISQAQTKLVDATARSQKLKTQAKIDSQQSVTFASLSQTPGIQQVLTQLQEAESELALQRNNFQSSHPTIIKLEEKVATLKNLLKQRTGEVTASNQPISVGNLQIGQMRQNLIQDFAHTESERVGLIKQIATLSDQLSAYKQRANTLPRLEQTQRQLERKLKAFQTTYETLLSKLQEVQVAENQSIGNARIISPAVLPEQPSGLSKIPIIGGGAVIGLILGIIAAFSLDLIDSSLKTVKEAQEFFQYTLLGVIPVVGKNGKKSLTRLKREQSLPQIIGRDCPYSPVGHVYQTLQAKLKFLSSDKQLKTIVVTSSVPKEGKSEVAANLAVAIAQMGRRVLLVDADMRCPTQHHIWHMTNIVGLSNLIVDQLSIPQSVREVQPHLYVLASGVEPPNPLALLDSKRMATLVASFAKEYDFVIFDTPALTVTADAAVLSKLADGMLLVVRPGVVKWNSANVAKEFLRQSGQNVLGMVINAVNVKQESDSYLYYSRNSLKFDSISRNSVVPKEIASRVIGKREI